ncbi:hypothetical protein ACI8AV_14690 [Geodermatophilus sp. SYSU D00804]
MTLTERTLWALAAAGYPAVPVHDYDAVHRTFGPAFGPWRPVVVGREGGPVTVLAAGGNTDPLAALAAVAEEWRALCDRPAQVPLAPCPEHPAAGDVARSAPQGLLLRHGLARLDGHAGDVDVPSDLPLELRPRR